LLSNFSWLVKKIVKNPIKKTTKKTRSKWPCRNDLSKMTPSSNQIGAIWGAFWPIFLVKKTLCSCSGGEHNISFGSSPTHLSQEKPFPWGKQPYSLGNMVHVVSPILEHNHFLMKLLFFEKHNHVPWKTQFLKMIVIFFNESHLQQTLRW
jgi:hypothetical protein